MRRFQHHRTSGRDHALDGTLGARGLEGDLVPSEPDAGYPPRPFAIDAALEAPVEVPGGTAPDPDRLLARGDEAAALARFAEAEALYRELLDLVPGHPAGSAARARLLERQGDVPGALECLGRALRQHPDDHRLLLERAALNRRRKELGDAEADVRRVLKADPKHAGALLELGLVQLRRGLALDAAETLRRYAELRPQDPTAWFHVGEALNQAGELAGALDALRRAVELDEREGRSYQLIGRVLDRMGRPEEAMPMYRRAREIANT
ncbi:MAG TPA: tetratricopeptide repeat protein [Gemmatimonadales bacterium]|nr:tetratricopeptide repeat protein [Gemmatimonadales bacterium]